MSKYYEDLPGVLWLFVLVVLPEVARWMVEYWGEIAWVPAAAAFILIVVKGLMAVGQATKTPEGVDSYVPAPRKQRSVTRKFFLG